MNARDEAVVDCKYAKSLGHLSLHFDWWQPEHDPEVMSEDDREYQLTILEIQSKLNTPECLLEN